VVSCGRQGAGNRALGVVVKGVEHPRQFRRKFAECDQTATVHEPGTVRRMGSLATRAR
jgi:hypothetical protein